MTDLAAAWDIAHASLPLGWILGRPSYHAEERRWHVWAIGPRPFNRLTPPPQIAGEGSTEAGALLDLAAKLRAMAHD